MLKKFLCLGFVLLGIVTACGRADAEEKFPFLAETVKDGVNIRSGQSASFERIGRLKKGDTVVVVEKNYQWYRIKLPADADSYVSVDYLKLLNNTTGKVMANKVNIRSGAGVNFTTIGQLQQGDLVRVTGKANGWYKIEPIDASYGWVAEEFLTFKSPEIPSPRVVEPPIRNKYKLKQMAQTAQQPAASEPAAVPAANPADWIIASGFVESLGDRSPAQDVRHQIKVDEKTVYYLKGYRAVIDGFLNHKVKVEGKLQKDVKAGQPVLLVTKIQLVL